MTLHRLLTNIETISMNTIVGKNTWYTELLFFVAFLKKIRCAKMCEISHNFAHFPKIRFRTISHGVKSPPAYSAVQAECNVLRKRSLSAGVYFTGAVADHSILSITTMATHIKTSHPRPSYNIGNSDPQKAFP